MVEEPVVEEPLVEEPVVEEPTPVTAGPGRVEVGVVQLPAVRPTPAYPAEAAAMPSAAPRPPRGRGLRRVAPVGVVLALALTSAVATIVVLHVRSGGSTAGSLAEQATYSAPVAVPPGGAYVRTTVLAGGRLRVQHWIRPQTATRTVRVEIPRMQALASSQLMVTGVVLAVDGRRIETLHRIEGRGRVLRVPPARRIYLGYVLSGAVQTSDHPPGRALARVVALDVSAGSVASSVTTVVGARVLALACTPLASDALPRPCGASQARGWSVDLADGQVDDRVMAQLDLSSPPPVRP